MTSTWRQCIRTELAEVVPYSASDAPADVFLDANESPIVFPADVRQALGAHLGELSLARYPDVRARALRAYMAADLGVAEEQILFGNGSDELISLVAAAFGKPPPHQTRVRVLYPTPTFVMYKLGVLGTGATGIEVPLRNDFTLDEVALERTVLAGQPNIAFFARPNNPTGTLWPIEPMIKLAKLHPSLIVVIDEAYGMYAQESVVGLVDKHPNIVVLRTISKVGLAALRIGVLVGSRDLVAEIEKVRSPYNLGALNQAAALWMLTKHHDLIEAAVASVIASRDPLAESLKQLGFEVFPSRANFLLVRHAAAADIHQGLLGERIRVKNLSRPGALQNCLRITVGSAKENERLLAGLATVLKNLPSQAAPPGATASAS